MVCAVHVALPSRLLGQVPSSLLNLVTSDSSQSRRGNMHLPHWKSDALVCKHLVHQCSAPLAATRVSNGIGAPFPEQMHADRPCFRGGKHLGHKELSQQSEAQGRLLLNAGCICSSPTSSWHPPLSSDTDTCMLWVSFKCPAPKPSLVSSSSSALVGMPVKGLPQWQTSSASRMRNMYTTASYGRSSSSSSGARHGGKPDDTSYLNMWKRAKAREEAERKKMIMTTERQQEGSSGSGVHVGEDRTQQKQFSGARETTGEDHASQLIDRATAALAAAHALLRSRDAEKSRSQLTSIRGKLSPRASLLRSSRSMPTQVALPSETSPQFSQSSPPPPLLTGSALEERLRQKKAASGSWRMGAGKEEMTAATRASGVAVDGGECTVTEHEATAGHGENPSVSVEKIDEPAVPGPDFWTWIPPPVSQPVSLEDGWHSHSGVSAGEVGSPQPALQSEFQAGGVVSLPFMEPLEDGGGVLGLPLERQASTTGEASDWAVIFQSRAVMPLPPLQTLVELREADTDTQDDGVETGEGHIENEEGMEEQLKGFMQLPPVEEKDEDKVSIGENPWGRTTAEEGVNADGSRWWKETGTDELEDGGLCTWVAMRGSSADGEVEWQEKWWEACGTHGYKELGAEKSGRGADGSVWRETWREALWQDRYTGLPHIEKTADKWGKNGDEQEWHEMWWENYDGLGRANKGAEKSCRINPQTPVDPGHGHYWHEKWGEEYDGRGASTKYTCKSAERVERGGMGATKWGDQWEDKFGPGGVGKRSGETWWEGEDGQRWNRVWGEEHFGTGLVRKTGYSSSGESWDTTVEEQAFYADKPHFGFQQCMENSRRLREVQPFRKIQKKPQPQKQ
ncbi:hypothetical protein CBR_g19275 [Chara braunii]|uniref:Uncharacterized protein n=1 Tax=Chara braunii TaxID=69332 RepID=A0A388KXT4_CHABU|nr:hypothetical protein CBR_g19275 [Chara braunii]|eukprot:GBG74763.1 hypothetical protein CBR_g19275 [Chara braunii]